jgi:alpha-mannosidase
LYDGVPRIDLKMTADWQEVGDSTTPAPLLKIAFPTSLENAKASFEIPFGSIERPTDGKEVPAQKWVDLSETDYGVSLLNDCKYGFDVNGSVIRGTILRTPYFPDPKSDVGRHKVTYSIYPHKGGWQEAGTVRRGYELNEPLIARVADSHPGSLPAETSYLSLSAPNLVVTALKQAEDGDGTILRFYESSGSGCRTQVSVALPVGHYVETDLMEKPVGKKTAIKGGAFAVSVGKWEIKTYKLMR